MSCFKNLPTQGGTTINPFTATFLYMPTFHTSRKGYLKVLLNICRVSPKPVMSPQLLNCFYIISFCTFKVVIFSCTSIIFCTQNIAIYVKYTKFCCQKHLKNMPQKLLQKHSLERCLKLFNWYKRMTSPMGPFNDKKEKR